MGATKIIEIVAITNQSGILLRIFVGLSNNINTTDVIMEANNVTAKKKYIKGIKNIEKLYTSSSYKTTIATVNIEA
jgi:hypothetical protein